MKIKSKIFDYLKQKRIEESRITLDAKTGCEWEYFVPDELPDLDSYKSTPSVFDEKQQQKQTININRSEIADQKDSNDDFEEYLKLVNIDKDSATNNELSDALNDYNKQIAKKKEFNEFYALYKDNSNYLKDSEDIDRLFKQVQETGAFKTENENGSADYNETFNQNIDEAIKKMTKEINRYGYAEERMQAQKISKKYDNNQTEFVVGKRDTSNVNLNSTIDEKVQQQGTGDCYLLATINSLQETDAGKEILKNAIKDNKDGSYTVRFEGVNKSFTFSAEEIEAADLKVVQNKKDSKSVVGSGQGLYSEGDDDAMLIEMAVEKFRQGLYDGSIKPDESWPKYVSKTISKDKADAGKSALTSGSMNQIMYMFTGKSVKTVVNENYNVDNLLDIVSKNPNKYVVYASVSAKNGYKEDEDGEYYIENSTFKKIKEGVSDKFKRYSFSNQGSNKSGIVLNGVGNCSGQKIKITTNSTGNHAISIVAATRNSVTIINPWDSTKKITVSRTDFVKYVNATQYMNLDEV